MPFSQSESALACRLDIPSTKLVNRVTLAAFLRPLGRVIPMRSSLSRNTFPPSFDFALESQILSLFDITAMHCNARHSDCTLSWFMRKILRVV